MDTRTILGLTTPQKASSEKEVQELLELNELMAKLERIDLAKVEEQLEAAKTPLQKTIEALQKNEKLITRKPKRKKVHHKTRKKRTNEYYARVVAPKRKARIAREMAVGGWWPRMADTWNRHKVPVEMTKEEWDREVMPLVGDRVPVVNRYDRRAPIALGNVWVVDGETGKVLFDGKEFLLREMGCIL